MKFTATDSAEPGIETILISDASKAVNMNPGDFEKATEELKSKGIKTTTPDKIWTQRLLVFWIAVCGVFLQKTVEDIERDIEFVFFLDKINPRVFLQFRVKFFPVFF